MPRALTTFYIVRHGQTQWNKKGILQGHLDSPLTRMGIKQAKERATFFSTYHFDAVFSSDIWRAHRTAKILLLEREMAVITTALLREGSLGKYEGRKIQDLEMDLRDLIEEHEQLSTREHIKYKLAPDIESNEEMVHRLTIFLRETALAYEGKTVLIVSHGSIIRSLLLQLGYGTHKELPEGCISNLGFVKLASDGTDFFIQETEGVKKLSLSKHP